MSLNSAVIPAKAGIQATGEMRSWIPAFAGMTAMRKCVRIHD